MRTAPSINTRALRLIIAINRPLTTKTKGFGDHYGLFPMDDKTSTAFLSQPPVAKLTKVLGIAAPVTLATAMFPIIAC